MKTISYYNTDKTKWGDGPWRTEPDKVQWQDPATGYPCLIVRNQQGALCGYAGVTPQHPAFGKKYDDHGDLECHGGLTFAGGCQPREDEGFGVCHTPGAGEPDAVWWLGFDCAHFYDVSPGMDAMYAGLGINFNFGTDRDTVYRQLDYVTQQVTCLAAQLHALAQGEAPR